MPSRVELIVRQALARRPLRNGPETRARKVELLNPALPDDRVRLLLDDVPLLVLERGEPVRQPQLVGHRLDPAAEQLERLGFAEPRPKLIRGRLRARLLAERPGSGDDRVKVHVRRKRFRKPVEVLRRQHVDELFADVDCRPRRVHVRIMRERRPNLNRAAHPLVAEADALPPGLEAVGA